MSTPERNFNCDELVEAVEEGDLTRTRHILDKNGRDTPALCTSKGSQWYTALHTAATTGDGDIVELLLSKGADGDSRNAWRNESPLHFAAMKGHLNVARSLTSHGVNINAQNISGWTPLHYATNGGHINMASLLIACGANVDTKDCDMERPLHLAVANGHEALVELLLENRALVNPRDRDGNTPLHYAVEAHNAIITKCLLTHGARPVARNKKGVSCIELAETNNFFSEVMATQVEPEVRSLSALSLQSQVTLRLRKRLTLGSKEKSSFESLL